MSKGSGAAGPLSGIIVADFSRVLAGPLASMFLADLGATVIKVEHPDTGDDTRQWGPPFAGEMTTYFASVNRNKRSVGLNLSEDDDLKMAGLLANRADVFLENFMPGKLRDVGLDAESIWKTNPKLIYCSISGFGSEIGSQLPGYDFVVQAVGGLMSITGTRSDGPTKVGVAIVDVVTGLHATIGILAALRERDRSGLGQLVEVNLLSSLLSSMVNQASAFVNGAGVPKRMGNQHPSIAPYEILYARDAPLAIAAANDRQFKSLLAVLGLTDLSGDERFTTNSDRVRNRDVLATRLEEVLKTDSVENWTTKLQSAKVPSGPINDLSGAMNLAASLGLDPIISHSSSVGDHVVDTVANPLRMSRTPVSYYRAPPTLGQDTDDVLRWLTTDDDSMLEL
jgi:crotonobetainyl-CoA:carnitine CoA-transferase CaiB-like acyl-CoA transferase